MHIITIICFDVTHGSQKHNDGKKLPFKIFLVTRPNVHFPWIGLIFDDLYPKADTFIMRVFGIKESQVFSCESS